MTLFSGPEHASYIALCRELRLERRAELLDIFVNYWPDGYEVEFVQDKMQARLMRLPDGNNWSGSVWLPRLDQLLTMLEKAGWVYHLTSRRPGYAIWARLSSTGTGRIEAATPEEAALRLYCAVTGREVKA